MKHTDSAFQFARSISRRIVLTIIVGFLVVVFTGACGLPFSDDDATEEASPTSVTGDIPDQPSETTPTPEAVAEDRDDGWTVIVGRDRQQPPESRSADQVLRTAGPSDVPRTIDPALARDTDAAFLARQVFRGLVRLDAQLEPVPDLARQVEIAPDGRLYRFTLHEGITFHDGTQITAEHVKASLERATDPALTGGDGEALPSRNYLDDIQGARARMDGEREDIPGIVVVDELTLEISLEQGVVDFLERLSNPSTLIVDSAQASPEGDWWMEANGTGPFRLIEWDPERQITLEAHDGYVFPPGLDRVEIRVGAESVGQMQLYETGQIDYVNVPLSVIDRVQYERSPIPGDLRTESLLSTSFLIMSPNYHPFDVPAFREALIRTLPRDRITGVMLDGRVDTANGVLPPEMIGESETPYPFDFDPETARQLLLDAQDERTIDGVTVFSSGGSVPVVMKHFIEQELGLPVEVVQLRWADYMADMEEELLPVFTLTWVADGPDPVSFLRALFHSESPDNYAGYSDPEVDDLLDRAAVEQDEEERTRLILDAHDRILESGLVVPLYHSVEFLLVADDVRGLETTPMGILGLESVWIGE